MKTIKNFIKYLKPYSLFAILAPLCMMVEVALDLMQPALMQKMIDIGVANGDLTYVIKTGLLMIGLACIGFMGGFGSGIFSNIAALKFGKDLRQDLFAKVQSLSFGNLDRLETGHIITRLTNDVTQVQDTLGMMLRVVVRAPALMIGSFILAIVSVPSLSPILLVIFPLLVVTIMLIIKRAFPVFSKVQQKLDRVNIVMQENLSGMRVVKAFVRTDFEKTRFKTANDDLMQTSISGSRIVNLMMPFMMLFMNLGIVAVLWFGGLQVNTGSLQVGQLLAFINYLMRLLSSLMMISMILMRLSRAQASTVRIQEVLNSIPDIPNTTSPKHKPTKGRVTFQNVTFSYNGQLDDPVLKTINFTADPGETIAILGATGSGKTTLIQLIPRFYEATQGQILIDDIDVKNYDKHALRRKIGFALQQTILFSGTIRDNIRYGRPEASDAEVEVAARAAQAHEFIVQSPQGYDTQVGQRGVNLSGGQKQRLAIARALLADPTILILDDSTSAVDVQTESLIQEALKGLMQNRTSFIVAQRISTVLEADRIIILENGRINAIGTHTELIQNNAIYRDIYQSQLGKEGLPHVS